MIRIRRSQFSPFLRLSVLSKINVGITSPRFFRKFEKQRINASTTAAAAAAADAGCRCRGGCGGVVDGGRHDPVDGRFDGRCGRRRRRKRRGEGRGETQHRTEFRKHREWFKMGKWSILEKEIKILIRNALCIMRGRTEFSIVLCNFVLFSVSYTAM